jgi:hypothetical protein
MDGQLSTLKFVKNMYADIKSTFSSGEQVHMMQML